MGARLLLISYMLVIAPLLKNKANAQSESDFRTIQFSSDRVVKAWETYVNPLNKLFEAKDLQWPGKDLYLRAFKLENELEVWTKDAKTQQFQLIKTYRICALSGKPGPKRKKGDKQVPEGFYFIEDFNAHSDFHLSMGINYPNYSDLMNTGGSNPGGDIYIHGGCLTVGCLPMEDEGIKEIYTLCLNAKLNGQNYIPVHIYPTRLTNHGMAILQKETNNTSLLGFWQNLKQSYDYFEVYHKLLPVMYGSDGNYLN